MALATLLGALVGLERERQGKSAGLRTHALVCLGSALITIVSIHGFGQVGPGLRDPARVAAQVVSGIGFLGAGTIMREGLSIRGLTTAASLWTTAGIGLAIGSGMVWPAIGATVLVEFVLVAMSRIERKYFPHGEAILKVNAIDRSGLLGEIATIVGKHDMNIVGTDINVDKENSLVSIDVIVAPSVVGRDALVAQAELLQHILSLSGVLKAEMERF
ncbi:MAG: MgtC/SapB family protein [Firmicutes bacterium]|nr:MgtC/SapB family protein [Bacillota bacterium]